ncbi:uncharacterized protein EV422DRAFT_567419 [Fimicolochytrium jonesii]|uniref:uncharacterized protein n=1 Tax=Fimicolochytrium jonesii TaxID=1396493 RepID=UPI0022FDF720|nr:uncharacterized protein EV422DRAFT_567419 [Fimicolochytrium jonesii]KAI8821097.1 hypothetical protein EV422DRAFT_567419 [Fimicolochytrium jonesii]
MLSCTNPQLRMNVVQLLLSRMKQSSVIMDALQPGRPLSTVRTALSTVHQLAKNEEYRKDLARRGFLKKLVELLLSSTDQDVSRLALMGLCRLIDGSESRAVRIVRYGVIPPLASIIALSGSCVDDLVHWTLLLAHQLTLCEDVQIRLLDAGFLMHMGRLVRLTYGNDSLQRLCMHSIVRLLSKIPSFELLWELQELQSLDLLPLLAMGLRSDDNQLVCWSLFLIHEFVNKDIGKEQLASVRTVYTSLSALLGHEEDNVPRLAFGTLKHLASGNSQIQKDMIASGIVGAVVPMLKTVPGGSAESACCNALVKDVHSSIRCALDVTLCPEEAHPEFIAANGFSLLLAFDASTDQNSLRIVDILMYFTGNPSNRPHIETHDVAGTVMRICSSDDPELQYAGCALLLHLVGVSELTRQKLVAAGALEHLNALLLDGERKDVQVVAAKVLETLGRKDPTLTEYILYTAIMPLAGLLRQDGGEYIKEREVYAHDTHMVSPLVEEITGRLMALDVILCSDVFTLPGEFPWEALEELLRDLVGVAARKDDGSLSGKGRIKSEERLEGWHRAIPTSEPTTPISGGTDDPFSTEADTDDTLMSQCLKVYAKIVKQVTAAGDDGAATNALLPDLMTLLRRPTTHDAAAALLSVLASIPAHKPAILPLSSTFLKLPLPNGPTRLYTTAFQESAFDFTPATSQSILPENYITFFRPPTATSGLKISPQGCELLNDSWTFETAYSRTSVSGSGRYAYEVELRSDGILQIGWAERVAGWDPEVGVGVGDDEYSYAVDGNRGKKWHAGVTTDNDYGEDWFIGDIITAVIDLDAGELEYFKNGKSVGAAFTGIDADVAWYPAISLAAGQGCKVRFGDGVDPICFLPDGTLPIPALMKSKEGKDIVGGHGPNPPVDVVEQGVDSHSWIALFTPTSYYEVHIGLRGLNYESIPQIGITTKSGTLLILALPSGQIATLLSIRGGILMNDLQSRIQDILENPGQDDLVRVLRQWDGPALREGDVIGCGVDTKEGCVGFTLNGREYGPLVHVGHLDDVETPYLCIVPRFQFVIEPPFLWRSGVSLYS